MNLPANMQQPLTTAQQTTIINLVRRAARAEILPQYRALDTLNIEQKTNALDLVTDADKATEVMLRRGLAHIFPDALIVGEETIAETPALRDKIEDAPWAVIIDPIDGTWNFAHGLGVFGTILSITRFGQPVFGLLYDALMDDWIVSNETQGTTTRETAQGRSIPAKTAAPKPLSDLYGFIHTRLMEKDVQKDVAVAGLALANHEPLRCSCHEYRLVAQGRADFCLSSKLNPWDHAAGVFAVQNAGGVARFLDGRDYKTDVREGYLLTASNEETWASLRDHFAFLIAPSGEEATK